MRIRVAPARRPRLVSAIAVATTVAASLDPHRVRRGLRRVR